MGVLRYWDESQVQWERGKTWRNKQYECGMNALFDNKTLEEMNKVKGGPPKKHIL